MVMQPVQPPAQGRANLVQVLDGFGTVAAGAASEHDSRSTSPDPAEFQ